MMPAAQKLTTVGFTPASMTVKRVRDPMDYLEYFSSMGFGGAQVGFGNDTPLETIHAVREKAGSMGLYLEGSTSLARDDSDECETRLKRYQEMGVNVFRTTCLSGRRYETFSTLGEWKEAVKEFKRRLALTMSVCERLKITMAVENHKDWTVEDNLLLLKEYESEYFGVCLDFGNNISLLDDPNGAIEALAPYAAATHIKDIAIEEYEDGFYKAQVPLGTGIIDLKRATATVKKHRPNTNLSLEMMSRNPLKVPCLTDKYWATFPDRSGRYLSRALALVKKRGRKLHDMTNMSQQEKEAFERKNFDISIDYARNELGLVA
jgi:sugar phosphate isomerase/epimerase